MKRKFFLSPSGRLHGMANCSGGPGRQRMRAKTLTPDQWRAFAPKCLCARWTVVELQQKDNEVY